MNTNMVMLVSIGGNYRLLLRVKTHGSHVFMNAYKLTLLSLAATCYRLSDTPASLCKPYIVNKCQQA